MKKRLTLKEQLSKRKKERADEKFKKFLKEQKRKIDNKKKEERKILRDPKILIKLKKERAKENKRKSNIRAKKYYKIHKEIIKKERNNEVKNLSDTYCRNLLLQSGNLEFNDINKELISLKRIHVKAFRKLKECID